ncbi:unnamed protein product, partial [Discosporangium mesarthrocarpum]
SAQGGSAVQEANGMGEPENSPGVYGEEAYSGMLVNRPRQSGRRRHWREKKREQGGLVGRHTPCAAWTTTGTPDTSGSHAPFHLLGSVTATTLTA